MTTARPHETASPGQGPWAALDPGRSKCGLVLSNPEATSIVEAAVLPPDNCWQRLQSWQQRRPLQAVILGDGTGSGAWQQQLTELGAAVILVPERGTTLEARQRYWQLEPPNLWQRLLPRGLRLPSRDWDDVVAQLLLERHLKRELSRTLA